MKRWFFTWSLDNNGLNIQAASTQEQMLFRATQRGENIMALETRPDATLEQAGKMAADAIGRLAIFQAIHGDKSVDNVPVNMRE